MKNKMVLLHSHTFVSRALFLVQISFRISSLLQLFFLLLFQLLYFLYSLMIPLCK